MLISERIKTILLERDAKQVDFAKTLGVSGNYVNQLVNGKKDNISNTLAKLIEEIYGYSAQWIMTGEGDKFSGPKFSSTKLELFKKIQKMPDDEIVALLAFANSLENIKRVFKNKKNDNTD